MSAVPKLRFPKFDGEWEESSLSSVVSMKSGNFIRAAEIIEASEQGTYPCYGGNGLRGYVRTHNHDGKYVLIGRQGALCGNVLLVNGAFYATEHAVVTKAKSGNDITWLRYQLDRMNLNQYSTGLAQPGLSVSNLNKLSNFIPFLPEQQEIASFLSSVDKKIDLLRQKKDALELYKKGLMQKIFSQEIRFKHDDGVDFPDWEEVALGDIGNFENNLRKPITKKDRSIGVFPYYGASGIVDFVDHYNFDGPRLLLGEDGAKWNSYEYTAFIADGKYCVNNHAHVIKMEPHDLQLVRDILYVLDLSKWVTGAAPPKLTLDNARKIKFYLPKSFDERKIVASFLSIIDAKIQKLSSQIEQLETFKKGLLQQMFV